jgi:RimJ/RimL family protein N-acetyltransferase
MPDSIPTLEGERIILRDKVPEDRENYLATGGQPEAIWGFGGNKNDVRAKTQEEADRFMEGRPGWVTWMIALNDSQNDRIGSISFHDIVEQDRRATLAIGISSASDMNRGFGTEAIGLLLAHGFESMNLHRVVLRVLARNKRAIRAYEKCGFRIEGTERDAALIDGKWEDDLIMSILEHEFKR